MKQHAWVLAAVVGMFCGMPSPALAQTTANSFEELRGLLRASQVVTVVEANGEVTHGRVTGISTDSFVVGTLAAGRPIKSFGNGPLRAVVQNDGVVNGIVMGTLAGVAGAAIATALCTGCEPGLVFLYAAAGMIPGGAAVGGVADWLKRNGEVRIEYGRPTGGSRVSLLPFADRKTRGIALSLRF